MNSLRSLPISRRLWLILIVAIAMLGIQGSLLLSAMHTNLYSAKSEKLSMLYKSQQAF